jgi:hypothetical protein
VPPTPKNTLENSGQWSLYLLSSVLPGPTPRSHSRSFISVQYDHNLIGVGGLSLQAACNTARAAVVARAIIVNGLSRMIGMLHGGKGVCQLHQHDNRRAVRAVRSKINGLGYILTH